MEQDNTIEHDNHVIHGPRPFIPLPTETMGRDLYRSLSAAPENSVVMIDVFTGEKLLYTQLFQASVNLAEALRLQGYHGQSTVLSISSENSLSFFVPILASLFNGSIMAPLNHTYTPYELEHTLGISTPKIVFCSEEVAQKFVDLREGKMKYIEKIIIMNKNISKVKSKIPGLVQTLDNYIRDVLKGREMDTSKFEPVDGDTSKMAAFILCSSGTTGLSKGVMLSHLNFMVRKIHSRDPEYFSQESNDNILGLLPFYHAFGLSVVLGAIGTNSTVICHKRFDEDIFLHSIEKYRISVLALVPPLAIFFAKSPKVSQYDLSSIKDVYCGAAPLSKNTEEEIKRRLKCKAVRQAYGLTESTFAVTLVKLNELKPGSSGKILPFMSCKVRDPETGKSLGVNQVGELCWKGPLVMMGYYKNEKATRETFTNDGWLRTGDLGYYDEEGSFYIIDRLKELIKYKSFQVAPAELEAILINHPQIDDVGVVGLPDELVGERPVAFVVRKEGTTITEEEIQKFVAGMVSPQKRLSGGVIFVDSIPKLLSGKILRRSLRESLKKHKSKFVESKL